MELIMKRKFVRYVVVSMLCMLGVTGCSYSTQERNSEEIQTIETSQTNNNESIIDKDISNNTETENDSITVNSTANIPQKDSNSSVLPGDISESTYEMELFTKAPNQDSSIKIQYPVFSGNKAKEINALILTQVQDIAWLDPSRFPKNAKETVDFQSAVTLQNSKIISIVFWGTSDINVSQFPTTNLYSLNIDLQSLKLIALTDLFTINEEFEKTFFEKAFFPTNPVTSYSEEQFPEMLKLQTPEYQSISPFSNPEVVKCFLKPEGIVLSLFSVHASGSDHFEAELLYNDIQEYYLPEQNYWKQ
jgi:hypothetical protein